MLECLPGIGPCGKLFGRVLGAERLRPGGPLKWEGARPAPSMSRGLSAAHHRRWAAYAMSLEFRV